MEEILKPIENFDGYFISNLGNVYSENGHQRVQMRTWIDSRGNYESVYLSCAGKRKIFLVHRLVAMAFIPNPNNLPEVNHKDKNKKNNVVTNLEWCTRKENLKDSYLTMSPNRNFQKCKLYVDDKCVGEFDGVIRAARFAKEQYGASESSLEKYLKWTNISIAFEGIEDRKVYDGHTCSKAQNRKPIFVYKNNELIGEFKSYKQVQKFLEKYDIYVSETWVRIAHDRNTTVHGFKIVR